MRAIDVTLKSRSYGVLVGNGLLASAGDFIAKVFPAGIRTAIVTDGTVGPLYADPLAASLRRAGFPPLVVTVPPGEASKSMACAERVCREMVRGQLDRSSAVIALGGGVVGDLAGFCAAIFFRGIPYVQVPTTVVAQVDSSIGGKTGVNTGEGKNLLGSFHQPSLVLADVGTLDTLPRREFNEGFAEVIKHAAIRDAGMFPLIERAHADRSALGELVARNVEIKARIVEADERETSGERALLNFGHTIGHAIEAAAGYGAYLHGEAIALGIRAALQLSEDIGGLAPRDGRAIGSLLDRFELPRHLAPGVSTAAILETMGRDKKFAAGRIRFVLLRRAGEAFVSGEVTTAQIADAVDRLRAP
jgi:3-dehydroquinate synthase